MAQISGVEVQSITSMYGVEVTSIVSIGGISTANIPGWPTGATCTTVYYGYAPSREGTAPEEACTAEPLAYEWDDANQVLFNEGGCGVELARPGYYSDGKNIYFWDRGKWGEYGPCSTVYEGPWVSSIATDDTMGMNGQYPIETLLAIYTANPNLSTIISPFNGEIWGYSLEKSNDSGSTYGPPSYYSGFTGNVSTPMQMFATDKSGNPATGLYFNSYGPNQPFSNRIYIDRAQSPDPYYGPQPYPNRLYDGRYFKQKIYPFWQDIGSFYETVFDSGNNSGSPFRIVSQTNYYNGSPNM